MASIGIINFKGSSGQSYEFDIYPWRTSFNPIEAVYVITKRYKTSDGDYNHKVVYIGQTEDLSERFDNHHKADCFTKYNANCICIHKEKSKSEREKIEEDLISHYNPLCND